ncbi:helix-turn-helix domain-containing protein [Pannonibacter carbonis]|uniref:helix-turn-helix domain-containing protein n=1 Tax=Pannonibacter carbonis TaxID=2067569 RepID=UPI000D0FF666
MTDGRPVAVLTKDLGASLASHRLSRNLRQDDVAAQAGVSRGVVARLEAGEGGTIDSLIRVLKALGLEDRISVLVPVATLSPLDPRGRGDQRQRARPASGAEEDEPWSWGE